MHADPTDRDSDGAAIANDSPVVRDYLAVSHAIGDYLLKTLDAVCEAEEIPYFIYAGTLLGAVRSDGWIPWDDDIDVAMFREDFERFRRVCSQHLPDDVAYSDYLSDLTHVDTIPRLLFIPSERQQFGRKYKVTPPNMRHVGLDIFIMDRVPRGRLTNYAWLKAVRLSEKLMVARSTSLRDTLSHQGHGVPMRVAESAVVALSRLVSPRSIRRLHHGLVRRWEGSSRAEQFAGCNHFEKRLRSLPFTRGAFFPPQQVTFAGRDFPAPRDSELILTESYGDYLTPPPVAKRVPLHLRSGLEATIDGRTWTFGPES